MRRSIPDQAGILLAAIAGGFLFSAVGVPIPWMLGPMAASMAIAVASGRPRNFPRWMQSTALTILGISVGLNVPPEVVRLLGGDLPALLVVVGVTIGLSMLNGWALTRFAGVDAASGYLGSVPGAASGMVAMSVEMGADARIVAVLQYVRLVTVAFLSPILVHWLFPLPDVVTGVGAAPAAHTFLLPDWAGMPAVILAGFAGSWVTMKARVPSGGFLGAMVATVALSWTGVAHPVLPGPLFAGALLALGTWVGAQFDWPTIRRIQRAAMIELLQTLGLIGVSLGLAFVLSRATAIDLRTAVLGVAPGAMEAQIALAFDTGANAPVVVAMHTIRVLIVVSSGPWVVARLTRSTVH